MPPVSSAASRFLVVDGFIDVGGSAMIKMTRSLPLASKAAHTPAEKGATVTIESSKGEMFPLTEGDSAVYTASGLDVSIGNSYTLHIRTADGQEYQSDAVQIYTSPAIDKVHFGVSVVGDELNVYVDAHDDNPDATGFYLWDCIETYEYHAPIYAGFKLNSNGIITERHPEEILYTCWRSDVVPSIMRSTKFLSESIINSQRIATIERTSRKISVRYSILVKQRAISEAEFAFRTQLQRSTEQQGSLFAQIPGTVTSNIRSQTNPGEYVLGYFRGQDLREQRFFIERADLPEDFRLPHSLEGCQVEVSCSVAPGGGSAGGFGCINPYTLGANSMIVSANTDGRGNVISYNVASAACADCRYKGGSLTPPDFW